MSQGFCGWRFGRKTRWGVDYIYAKDGRKTIDIVLNTNRYGAGDFDYDVPVSVFETDNVAKSSKLWYLRYQMNEKIDDLRNYQEQVTTISGEVSSLHYQIQQLEKAE